MSHQLGLLLYRLLTGHRAFEAAEGDALRLLAAMRAGAQRPQSAPQSDRQHGAFTALAPALPGTSTASSCMRWKPIHVPATPAPASWRRILSAGDRGGPS